MKYTTVTIRRRYIEGDRLFRNGRPLDISLEGGGSLRSLLSARVRAPPSLELCCQLCCIPHRIFRYQCGTPSTSSSPVISRISHSWLASISCGQSWSPLGAYSDTSGVDIPVLARLLPSEMIPVPSYSRSSEILEGEHPDCPLRPFTAVLPSNAVSRLWLGLSSQRGEKGLCRLAGRGDLLSLSPSSSLPASGLSAERSKGVDRFSKPIVLLSCCPLSKVRRLCEVSRLPSPISGLLSLSNTIGSSGALWASIKSIAT